MTGKTAAEIEAEVRQNLTDRIEFYRDAVLRGDAQAAASFWTSDAWELGPGVSVKGDEQKAALVEAVGSGAITAFDIELLDLSVHGDVAYGIYQYSLTLQMEGQQPVTVANNSFSRWEKEDGVWKVSRMVAGPRDAPPGG
jgi:ketosteroid isomerase-like protein